MNMTKTARPHSPLLALGRALWLCPVVLLALSGCNREPTIRQYTVPKTSSMARSTPGPGGSVVPRQILGAIVPKQEDAWFFKLMGDPEKVGQYEDDFRQLVNSLSFAEDGMPKWQLPEKWSEESGSQFTYANLRPPGEESLKVTVSPLPMPSEPADLDEEDWREYVKRNVNRWRDQLQLTEGSWEQIVQELEPIEKLSMDKAPAYFVSLRGRADESGGGSMGAMTTPNTSPMPPASKRPSADDIQFELPAGWREVDALSVMALKSLQVDADDGTKASITLTPAGGDAASNVARWSSQVGGTAEQAKQALESSEKFIVNGAPTEVVLVTGPEPEGQAILAAMIQWEPQSTLFVKMTGSTAAVQSQRDAFVSFTKSLKW